LRWQHFYDGRRTERPDKARANEVGAFGEQLRQAREAKHITLQEIAATTKISCRALQALEDEKFSQLPGGIFNKGFVRAYARYVGLDEEKMLAAYLAAAKVEGSPETDIQAMSSQVATARDRDSSVSGTTVVGVLALVVALALGGLWLREQRKEAREAAAAQASSPAVNVPVAPVTVVPSETSTVPEAAGSAEQNAVPAATTAAAPISVPAAVQSVSPSAGQSSAPNVPAAQPVSGVAKTGTDGAAPVEVSISATKRAWISVRSDGKTVESVTLDPDKPELRSRSYKAKEKLLVVVGNPAGLTVTYNGKPTGSLGPEGQRETIMFTPQGMEKQ
jgi:cytoskeleton protein RodZ